MNLIMAMRSLLNLSNKTFLIIFFFFNKSLLKHLEAEFINLLFLVTIN